MSWKKRLFSLSVAACLSVGMTNQGFAQEGAKTEKAAGEQAKEETKTEAAKTDYSQMTLDELTTDSRAKFKAYSRRYRAAPTREEKLAVSKTKQNIGVYKDRLTALINEDPGSDAGIEVIDWWFQRGGRRENTHYILKLVMKNYSTLPAIRKYVPCFRWYLEDDVAEVHLRELLKDNPDDEVQGYVRYELLGILRKRTEELDGDATEAVVAEMKSLNDSIYENHADVTDIQGAKLVTLLDAVEFSKQLAIGKPVPDIAGVDLDGVEFKLSDYDGKVRVISFWGDW